jgi:hypothetical protein
MTVAPAVAVRVRRTRRFYVAMALAFALTVFEGFSRTYFLKLHYGGPALSFPLHVHGVVFSAWVLLFPAQTSLVAARRTDLHRRIGVVGAGLAGALLVMGTATAILRVRGGSAPIPGVSGLAFLAIPLFDMVVFAILAGTGLALRRRLETHKRLMTLATVGLMSAPIARIPWVFRSGPLAFFGLTNLFVVAMLVYDLATRRRVQPATVWGGLVLVASQPLRLMISGTAAWTAFAAWATGW